MDQSVLGSPLSQIAEASRDRPFDAVVVGAGSSGLTVAQTLAEAGRSVAVVEAGPAPFLTHITNTELRFSSSLSRQVRGRVQYSPRLADGEPFGNNYSCFGGRGLFWNGAAPRYQPHDLTGWPLGPDDLAPYFGWAEREFRVTDRLGRTPLADTIVEGLRARGLSAVPGPFAVDGGGEGPGALGAGVGSGMASFFRNAGDAVADGRVQVSVGVTAHRVLIEGGQCEGLEVSEGPEGERVAIRARAVVLAGGGIGSIRLALLSDVPDPSGRVGVGLQDHLFLRWYFEGPGLYGDAADTAVVYVPSTSQDGEQWEIHAPGNRLFTLDDGAPWAPGPGPDYHLMIRSFAATEKRDANRVTAEPGGIANATVHFGYSAADDALVARIRERARDVAGALGLTEVEARLSGPGGSYHEAGGLDMGHDPGTSVTAPDGRFHTVPNLVCADAAAFPRIGATNPHITIAAIARYKAERLAESLA